MAKIPGSVRITGPVAPTDTSDIYPSHLAFYGKGGIRTVTNLSERDSLPMDRRENGMLVYVTATDKYYKLIDSSTNTYEEFRVGGSSNRIYYDAAPYMTMIYPANASLIINCLAKFAPWLPHLNINYFTFQRDIIDPTTNGGAGSIISTVEGIKYNSLVAVADWMNANLSHGVGKFSQTIKLTAYEDVDSAIPILEKGYGSNRFYNSCVGPGEYRKAVHCNGGNCHATTYVLFQAWKALNPSGTWIGYTDCNDWQNHGGRGTVWCAKNDVHRYNLPSCLDSWNSRIIIGSVDQGERKIICENFENVNTVYPDTYTLGDMRICIMKTWGNPPVSNLYNVLRKEKDKATIRYELTTDPNSTACAIYQVKGSASEDNNYALFVKPLGIDVVYTNYVDLTQWNIEAVFRNTNRQSFFKVLGSSDIIRQNAVKDMTMIRKSAWLSAPFAGFNIWRDQTKSKCWQVRFRLRNKTTLKAGPLTSWKIVAKQEVNAPLKFMVE